MVLQPAIGDSDVIDGLSVWFLKAFGIWRVINLYRTTGKYSKIIKMYLLVSFLLTAPALIIQWLSIFILKLDIQKAIFLYMHPLPGVHLFCRILFFWFQMDRMCNLYDLLRNDFLSVPRHLKEEIKMLYRNSTKASNQCSIITFSWNMGLIFWYMAFPKLPVDYIQYHTGSITAVRTGRKKILAGWYPVAMDKYPYYEIIFVFEAISLVWAATLLNVYFSLFYQLLNCLYAQYLVLSHRLSMLQIDLINHEIIGSSKTKINKELHEILQDHQKLLRYTDELKSVYNPLVSMTLAIGVLVLIIGTVQILLEKTSDPRFIFQLFQIFSTQLMEVSLLCFGSSLVENVSSDLQFAVYCSDWYKADVKFRKAAQMLMVRTRRSSTLTAFATFPVNLETLNKILQMTYSVAALMSGLVE